MARTIRPLDSLLRRSSLHTLLLRAALPGSDPAAWQEWCRRVPLNDIDPDSYRLLPQIYLNLSQAPGPDPHLDRLKGVYRKTWVENQVWTRALRAAVTNLAAAGISPLLPGSAAVGGAYYPDMGARPFIDRELVIPFEAGAAAHQALTAHGWHQAGTQPAFASRLQTSVRYQSPDGAAFVDLTPTWLREVAHLATPAAHQPASHRVEIESVGVLALDATYQLLYLCLAGWRATSTLGLLWATDAWRILADTQLGVDWDRLVSLAGELRLSLPVAAALSFLKGELGAAIPATVTERLRAQPLTPAEQRFFERQATPRGAWGEAPVFLADHARRAEQGYPGGPLGLLHFLRDAWGLGHTQAVPGYALRRFVNRLRRA